MLASTILVTSSVIPVGSGSGVVGERYCSGSIMCIGGILFASSSSGDCRTTRLIDISCAADDGSLPTSNSLSDGLLEECHSSKLGIPHSSQRTMSY